MKRSFLLVFMLFLTTLLYVPVHAQEPVVISVTQTEPVQTVAGQSVQLSIFGANFTESTAVRLTGFGLLTTTFVNANALIAAVPANVPPGSYGIEVSDPVGGVANSPNIFTVLAPTLSPPPPATAAPTGVPTATLLPPTPVPGEPTLVIRSYSASSQVVAPGDTVILSLEIINQGNRVAQSVAIDVATGGSFSPASGQGTILLPNIGPGGIAYSNVALVAASSATDGPNTVTLNFAYTDFLGNTYTRASNLTINVQKFALTSQVTVARYSAEPVPALPGEPVRVTLELNNSGNQDAEQVLVKVNTAADSVLLPGPQGDTFPVGDLAAGDTIELELPMILNPAAKPGPQLQTLSLSLIQAGEAQQVSSGVTIEVGEKRTSEPLFLLQSYTSDPATLTPGDRFSLSIVIVNAGDTPADDVTLTFGGAQSQPLPTSEAATQNAPSTPSASANSTTFAATDAGATRFVGSVDAAGGRIEITQNFIVNGTVNSGIYDLPINLRYVGSSGRTEEETLTATLVVLRPPRLRLSLEASIGGPEYPVGQPSPVALTIINTGRQDVVLTIGEVTAENAEIVGDSESFIGTLRSGEDRTLETEIVPEEEGDVTLTFTLTYIDDFNQEQMIERSYTVTAAVVELPPDEFTPPPDFVPPPIEEPERDWLSRLVLAFMGLGS
ncbi:MAG: hypothetical protein KC519_11530 [Anaerolineae bacterium]|nr:hypothetical protein [Anaerolineae bacterium]